MFCVAVNIKKARLAKGFKQGDVAERLDVSQAAYSAYENGTKMPNVMMLKRIADALEVPVGSLYEEFDE